MFRLSPIIILFPKSTWPYPPLWLSGITSSKLVMSERTKGSSGRLAHLLVSEQMSVTEILGSIAELLLAGLDTVRCVFYEELFHSREKLYQEVISVCPGDKVPTSDDIIRMPWLKAVVRETLQMYRGVPGNAHINVENDIVGGGALTQKCDLHFYHLVLLEMFSIGKLKYLYFHPVCGDTITLVYPEIYITVRP
uniref:Uncharacterized protein n=1 Tax=Oncorhynchus kisutch TaxID=8019 RepID=A0A8C7IU14_ONCKI